MPLFRLGGGSEKSHWYSRDAQCAYEVLRAKPAKDGSLYKPTTLREAKLHGLYYSVSDVLSVAAKPQIETWKASNLGDAYLGSLAGPLVWTGALDAKAAKAITAELADGIGARARDVGTMGHANIEAALRGDSPPFPRYWDNVAAVVRWMQGWHQVDWRVEAAAVHPLGYGCRVDAYHAMDGGVVVDFKGKDDWDDKKPPTPYDDNIIQLAANRMALGLPQAECANVFFAREATGKCHVHWIPEERLQWGWEMFKALLVVKKLQTGYDPVKYWQAADAA